MLRLDRPGSPLNVLDGPTMEGLDAEIATIEVTPNVRVAVLRSGKPGGFAAGADLKRLRACRCSDEAREFLASGSAVLGRLAGLAVPTVAVVHGACLGGGLELALACRSVVALPGSRLGTPEVRLGLIPGWGAIPALVRRLGLGPALDLLLSGRAIEVDEAARLGLVDAVISGEGLPSNAEGWLALAQPAPTRRPPDHWLEALAAARGSVASDGLPHPEARRAVLDVIAVGLADGPEAGRAAALDSLAGLIVSEPARRAIDDFFARRPPGPT